MNKLSKLYFGAGLATYGFLQTAKMNLVSAKQQALVSNFDPGQGFADDFGSLLNAVMSFVMVIAALLVFFYLIWGGIEWITSGGDKGKTESARNKITAAVIGIIILAASFAILQLVLTFLGFSGINDALEFTTIS